MANNVYILQRKVMYIGKNHTTDITGPMTVTFDQEHRWKVWQPQKGIDLNGIERGEREGEEPQCRDDINNNCSVRFKIKQVNSYGGTQTSNRNNVIESICKYVPH